MSESFTVGTTPLFISATPDIERLVSNGGQGTVYHYSTPAVSSLTNDGSIAVREARIFRSPTWIVADAPTQVGVKTNESDNIPVYGTSDTSISTYQGGWVNVASQIGAGNGSHNDAVEASLDLAEAIGTDIYFGPLDGGYQIDGGWTMRSGVSIHGSGYAGRLVLDVTDFPKAQRGTFFRGSDGLGSTDPVDDVTIENLYVDGNEEEIVLATGLANGDVSCANAGKAFTVAASNDTFTSVAHGFTNGTLIRLASVVTTTVLTTRGNYFVVNKTNDTFQVSLTSGGTPVDIDLDGSGVTWTESHTVGQQPGVILLDGCSGSFGVPDSNPGFGVVVFGNQVLRYGGVTNNGTSAITLTACYGGTGTIADNIAVAEHSGNERMPAFNFNTGGERISFLNNVIINFPGQGFQGAGMTDFKCTGNYTYGHRGIVFRDTSTGIVTGNTITATDDCIAFLPADADEPPTVTVTGNVFTSLVDELEDEDSEPEYAGNGIVLYGVHDSVVAFNRVNGSGTETATGNDKAGIKISGALGGDWHCENLSVYANEILGANGYAIRIGGLGPDETFIENITVANNLVIEANQQGIFLSTQTADSRPKNIRIEANDLIDCGINNGAYDEAAMRTTSTAGSFYDGLYINRNNIIRPGRHGILMDSDIVARGGSFDGNNIEDPNQGNTASTPAASIHGFTKGTIRNNRVIQVSGRIDFTVEADGNVFTSTAHGMIDTTPVRLTEVSGATGITVGTLYYVRDKTTDTFKLAATSGGAAIDITLDGSGTLGSMAANGITVAATNSKLAVSDNFIDPDVITGVRVQDLSAAPNLIRGQDIVRKTANETVANDTIQNDDHLKFTVAAGETWHVVAVLDVTAASATADWKFGWSLPGTSTYKINISSLSDGVASGGTPNGWNTTTVAAGGAAADYGIELQSFLSVDTAGTANLQWAQNTNTAENNTIKAGSFLRITRL